MIVRSYKTSAITARVNIDMAITELQDLLIQFRLLRNSKLTDKVDLPEDCVPQLDDLAAKLHSFYDTIKN